MSGRGRGVKRKRTAPATRSSAKEAESRAEEGSQTDPVVLGSMTEGEQTSSRGETIDFGHILAAEGLVGQVRDVSRSVNALPGEMPELIRCGGDEDALAAHIPEPLLRKILANQYINIAALLKGGIELDAMYDSAGVLRVNEMGGLEAKAKPCTDVMPSIEKWTDAFIIFMSVYILKYPTRTQELLKYMSVIREAAATHPTGAWRMYDEQFRLKQSIRLRPWDKLDADLWIKIMSKQQAGFRKPVAQTAGPLKCRDFNGGICKWNPCKFAHVCMLCSSGGHGKWACPNQGTGAGQSQQTMGGPPRGASQGAFMNQGQQAVGGSFRAQNRRGRFWQANKQ